jgi:hypothetical protein
MEGAARFAIGAALAVYAAWVVGTYALEGLPGTLMRPDAPGLRLAYALVANLAVGILLPLWLMRKLVKRGWAAAEDFGFSGARRTAISVVAAGAIGYGLFLLNQERVVDPLVMLNSFSQTWVVSVAEIVVCWGLLGTTVFVSLRSWSRLGAYLAAAFVASAAFGLYHFAHSPPFNEPRMVVFLTGIGFATSAWWFASRDVYGTAVFHNFFALTGVLAALEAGGRVPERPQLALGLVATAAVLTLAVVVAGLAWIRTSTRS